MQNFNYHTHTYRCGHADDTMKDEDFVKEQIRMYKESIEVVNELIGKTIIDKLNFVKNGEF